MSVGGRGGDGGGDDSGEGSTVGSGAGSGSGVIVGSGLGTTTGVGAGLGAMTGVGAGRLRVFGVGLVVGVVVSVIEGGGGVAGVEVNMPLTLRLVAGVLVSSELLINTLGVVLA